MSTPQLTPTPVSPNMDESFVSGSALSEFHPMEDISSEASLNVSPRAADDLLQAGQANLDKLKNQYCILFGHYLSYQKVNPDSDNTKSAFTTCKEAERKYLDAKETFAIFKSIQEPVKMQDDKKFSLVPSSLPFLQLKTDIVVYKKNLEIFDSVYDFCTQFQTVLEAHSLNMDDHWERLLPMSLNKEERSWFDEKLRNKSLSWFQARNKILDHFDTPYRKFLLMVKVWTLKQQSGESTRVYAAKFQNLRRQADLQDGLQLVLCFWCSLRESVRRVASVAVSSQYGSKLPMKIEAMIDLVIASTNDTDLFSTSSGSSSGSPGFSGDKGNNERFSRKRSSHSFSPANKDYNMSDKAYPSSSYSSSSSGSSKRPCVYCKQTWFQGHRCKEFFESSNKKPKVSRMARRSETPDVTDEDSNMEDGENDDDENQHRLAALALECKSNIKKDKTITRENKEVTNNITFPILINNSFRMTALLDCGAGFSSVDLKFCKENKIDINYIQHINKNLVNKNNCYKYFIKLADNDVYTKRIGTCTLTVSCNNKTLKKEFEVMNLNDDNEFAISIGTDYMSLLGIGIYGLPTSYDDHDSTEEIMEAERRFNNKSELLEAIDAENSTHENCPACEPKEYNAAIEFISKYIKQNQSIPKGVFCTVPESVVCLDTPTDVTAYKKPYPIAINMHKVIDDQIAEWMDLGVIERASANTGWNTPLTVVKKTDGKGNITGYRVCHDPRHINALLKTVDRMPLPIISELFEDLKGASIYSTLDLKSAFNSLKLNPKDCHKLAFTWKGVQYQPIGTVFGIRHVSSQFQRTMSIVLDGLPFVRYFVDDIVCASQSVEEHKDHLKQVIQRLTNVNLKLNPAKCHFFQSEIYLLGFRISPKGISMDRRKLVNVIDFPVPKSGHDIMKYCGLINYFRTLIPGVSAIMAPLDKLRNEKSLDKLWNEKHQVAFDNLKKALLTDVVLSYPDMNSPFYISCDASLSGIGAVLHQKVNGEIKYISFIAKSLSKSERRYSAVKRELLALVFSLKRFHKYIYGSTFTLFTDNKALTYIHTQRTANLMMISWLDTILQYDFKIVHLPGITNILPDTLSRLFETTPTLSNELRGDKANKSTIVMRNSAARLENLPSITSGEYFTPPSQRERDELLKHEHIQGHFGEESLIQALKRKGIYWTNIKKDANELIQSCVQCQKENVIRKGFNPLRPVLSTLPGDSWGIDLTGPFTQSKQGNQYLLVMIDIASKYYVLRAIPDKSATTVCNELLNIICTFGPFRKLQSDHGSEFVNRLMSIIKKNIAFEHALISVLHPRSNGASERAVQSAVKTIRKQINGNVADWDCKVAPTQLFLNSKYNVRTKSTPFSLMFGRNPNDFKDYSQEKDEQTTRKINDDLQKKIRHMTEIVYPAIYERVTHVTNKQKSKFDSKHKLIDIPNGSKVMILITDRQNKLDPHYKGYYTTVRKTAAGTYVLRNEQGFLEPRNYPPSLLKVTSKNIITDDNYFEVEAIIGHKHDNKKNNYLYRCKWLNYDESYNSWEPPSNFTDPKFITEYWRRIGEVPETTTAINKANKKLLGQIKNQNNTITPKSVKRMRSTEQNKDQLINADKHKKSKRS
jgi:hypothetical protein